MSSEFIPFIENADPNKIGLTDDLGRECTYEELKSDSLKWCSRLTCEHRQLIFFFIDNKISNVKALLGAMASKNPVALIDSSLSDRAYTELIEKYQPEFIISNVDYNLEEYQCEAFEGLFLCTVNNAGTVTNIHPELCLLLSTSGSTGSPKFVRLSYKNIFSNAHQIAGVLNISSNEIAAGHLQLHYSYGFSVLTSFLVKNATVSLTQKSFMDRDFWDYLNDRDVTHLPGVPFHYQMMFRLRFQRLKLDKIKTMTQAGGRLDNIVKSTAHQFMEEAGGSFYVMYGQTEAAPRMTTLSHCDFRAKEDSVGKALKDSGIKIKSESGEVLPAGETGSVYFNGPNVMMGYAKERYDLQFGDINCGTLNTGDIGFLDEEGYLYITGRSKRIGKVYGWRVNLDEIERYIGKMIQSAVVQKNDTLCIFILKSDEKESVNLIEDLAIRFSLPERVYQIKLIDELPMTKRNKPNYKQLEAEY